MTLSPENQALIGRVLLQAVEPHATRAYSADQLNRLLDAAREEGRESMITRVNSFPPGPQDGYNPNPSYRPCRPDGHDAFKPVWRTKD